MEAEQERKLFVGGIPWQVNETMLEEHFSQYGEVEECVIVLDRIKYQSRGFGFVTFVDRLVAKKVLEENHSIFNRELVVSLSEPRRERSQYNRNQYAQLRRERSQNNRNQDAQHRGSYHPRKIFVGGLPHHLTDEEFINYFEKFGVVDRGLIIYDKETNTSRGFGFITFGSEEAVIDVMQENTHELKNATVEVCRARLDRRDNRSLITSHAVDNVGLEFEGGLRYDDLAFGVDRIFCYNCGGFYGYGHYQGCLYEGDPFNGTWKTMRVPLAYWVCGGEVDPWAWNGNLQYNGELLM